MTCELPAETRCKCIAPAANPSAISALPGQPSFSHHPLPSPLSTRFAVSFAPPPPVLTNTTEFYDLSIFCSTSPPDCDIRFPRPRIGTPPCLRGAINRRPMYVLAPCRIPSSHHWLPRRSQGRGWVVQVEAVSHSCTASCQLVVICLDQCAKAIKCTGGALSKSRDPISRSICLHARLYYHPPACSPRAIVSNYRNMGSRSSLWIGSWGSDLQNRTYFSSSNQRTYGN